MTVTAKAKPSPSSQLGQILRAMRRRWVTPMDALDNFGSFRLAARVADLRRLGYEVESRWQKTSGGHQVKAYRIAR